MLLCVLGGPAQPSFPAEPLAPSPYMQQLPEGQLPVLPSSYDFEIPKDPEPAAQEAAAAEGGEEGEEEPDTSNWVQCSRCQVRCVWRARLGGAGVAAGWWGRAGRSVGHATTTRLLGSRSLSLLQVWRVVPDEFWPDIEAANDEDWYCEVRARCGGAQAAGAVARWHRLPKRVWPLWQLRAPRRRRLGT